MSILQHFNSIAKSKGSPLVQELLKLPHVRDVFLGPDFVTVNKSEEVEWEVSS